MTKYQSGFFDAKTLDKPLYPEDDDYMAGWKDCRFLCFGEPIQ